MPTFLSIIGHWYENNQRHAESVIEHLNDEILRFAQDDHGARCASFLSLIRKDLIVGSIFISWCAGGKPAWGFLYVFTHSLTCLHRQAE